MRAADWRVLNALQGVSREAQVTTAWCQQVLLGSSGDAGQALRLLPDALRRLRGEVDGLLARLDAREEEP